MSTAGVKGATRTIFIFRHYATAPRQAGGRRHFNLAKLMADDGNPAFVFASNFHHMHREYSRSIDGLYAVEDVEGVRFVWIHNKPRYEKNDWKRLVNMLDYSVKAFRVALRLRRQGQEPDVIVGSVAHLFAVFSAWLTSRALRCTFWMDVGDIWPESYIEAGVLSKRHPLAMVMSLLSRFLYARAACLIVVTERSKAHLVGLGVEEDRIVVLPNGFMPDETESPPSTVTRNTRFTLTYTGSVGENYPVGELLKAVARLRDRGILVESRIIGAAGRGRERLETEAVRNRLDPVDIREPVPRSELGRFYQDSDALIVLEKNVTYGFPNKLVGYAIAGRPVIVASETDYGLPEEIFVCVEPEAESIANAVERLVRLEPEERDEIGQRVYRYAREHFDMKGHYERLLAPRLSRLSR